MLSRSNINILTWTWTSLSVMEMRNCVVASLKMEHPVSSDLSPAAALTTLIMPSVAIMVALQTFLPVKRRHQMQARVLNILNFSFKQTHLVLQPSWSMSRRRTKRRRITRRRRKWKQTMVSRTTTVLWWPQVHGSLIVLPSPLPLSNMSSAAPSASRDTLLSLHTFITLTHVCLLLSSQLRD